MVSAWVSTHISWGYSDGAHICWSQPPLAEGLCRLRDGGVISLPGGALFSCLIVAVAGSPRGYRQCFLPRSRGHRVFQEARCRCLFFRLLQPSQRLGETGRNLLAVLVFFFLFGPCRCRSSSSFFALVVVFAAFVLLLVFVILVFSSVWSSSSASPSPYLSRSPVCKHSD